MKRSIQMVWALSFLMGCSVIQDVGDPVTDVSCNFSVDLTGYAVHAGRSLDPSARELFEIDFVRRTTDEEGEVQRTLEAAAVFDPLPASSIKLTMPHAVLQALHRGEAPIELQIIADRQRDGRSTPTADHSWFVPRACDVAGQTYPHTTDFDDLTTSAPDTRVRGDLVVHHCETGDAFGPVEVHVTRFDLERDLFQEVALYRRARSNPAGPEESLIRLSQAIDDTTTSTIEILHDDAIGMDDLDGFPDATEEVWTRTFDPSSIELCAAVEESCMNETTICFLEDEVHVFVVGPADPGHLFESWWEEII